MINLEHFRFSVLSADQQRDTVRGEQASPRGCSVKVALHRSRAGRKISRVLSEQNFARNDREHHGKSMQQVCKHIFMGKLQGFMK